MPLVSTNDQELHLKLKEVVTAKRRQGMDVSIGKAVDLFTQFCLQGGFLELSETQQQEIIELVGRDGLAVLLDSRK